MLCTRWTSAPSRLVLALCAAALMTLAGCESCGPPPIVNPTDGGGIPCIVNSDCEGESYCGPQGLCIEGLPPGTCRTDLDCEGDEICVIPNGSDVGACLNPHECDDANDCQEGQVCEDGNDDGYRDCIFPGCEEDAECVDELAGTCTINEAARCVARACICRDLCGAPCGEGRQCCALPDTQATCIDDPGPCWMLDCEPGFAGTAPSYGDWAAPQCDYQDAACTCTELPPLPPGTAGTPHVLTVDGQGRTFVVAYNSTYGDVVVAEAESSPITGWVHVDGVPPVGPDSPIVAGPSGPRGGVGEPGDDVGRWLDAAFTTNGILHIVARDHTNGTLRHTFGPPAGPFESEVLDGDGDSGYAARITLDDQDRPVVAHVVRRTPADRTVLRVMAAGSAETNPSSWARYDVATFTLSGLACEGGCVEGEVCPDPGNASTPVCVAEATNCGASCDGVCTASGCEPAADAAPADHGLMVDSLALVRSGDEMVLFGHNPRTGVLTGIRSASGSVFDGSATFQTQTVLSSADADVGGQPSAARAGGGFYVLSTDATVRQVVMTETSATLTVLGTTVVDDGERPHPSGATSHHAVDNGVIALGTTQEGVIAWQDGTSGAVWGRWVLTDGTLGPSQLLGGAGAGPSYQGYFGFSVGAAAPPSGPVITAERVWLSADPPVSELVMLPLPLRCPDDDAFEPNDDAASAAPVDITEPVAGIICGNDDFYAVTVPGACTLDAEIAFRHGDGDLDLRLLDGAGTVVDSSLSVTDYETVAGEVAAGTYVLRINGFSAAENGYALRTQLTCE